jgi:hypothetical protein
MTRLLTGLGIFLIAWGAFVLVTGDFVATVDIAAGLVASGVGVIALSAIVRSLDRIGNLLAESNERRVGEQRMAQAQPQTHSQARPPVERPRAVAQPPQAEMPPQAPVERRPPPPAHPQLDAVERPQPKPEPERRPEPVEQRRPGPVAVETGPKLIREGIIEGQQYRFFDDGSIEAEGPGGVRRFRSIEEAREQIMRDRAGPSGQDEAPPRGRKPVAVPDAQRPPEDAPRPPRPADIEPAQRGGGKSQQDPKQDLTWDAYLSGGGRKPEDELPRIPDDDQWSEPFRMLLRGDPPPADPKPPKR